MTFVDVFDVAAALVERVRREFADDVALVAYYGSYARGTATDRSDFDVFFVPATDRGREAALTFLVGGISFDFWAIDWAWLERSARLEERGSAIVSEAQILYARSDAEGERFEKLRRLLLAVQTDGDPHTCSVLADDRLGEAYLPVHALRRAARSGSLPDCRRAAVAVVSALCSALAILNRTYLRRGAGGQIEEVLGLPLRPAELGDDLHAALYAQDVEVVRRACERALDNVAGLIAEHRESTMPQPLPVGATGFFEELSGVCDKLRTACAGGDYQTALFSAASIEQEVGRLFGPSDRPDLLSSARPADLAVLSRAVDDLEAALRRRLKAGGVSLREFESVAQFRAFSSEAAG
jgi:predicted nucleotidyltransferase